jgi:transcription elongation GreA/GreB family factor
MVDKHRLREAILERLKADLALVTRAAHLARDEATSEESKAEGKYDTRAQEAAYLAEGQAKQAADLLETIALYQNLPVNAVTDAVAIGAVITLQGAGQAGTYLLGPRAGGIEVDVDDTTIVVVTPSSPLGRQLLGRRKGEAVMLPGRGRPTVHVIDSYY